MPGCGAEVGKIWTNIVKEVNKKKKRQKKFAELDELLPFSMFPILVALHIEPF